MLNTIGEIIVGIFITLCSIVIILCIFLVIYIPFIALTPAQFCGYYIDNQGNNYVIMVNKLYAPDHVVYSCQDLTECVQVNLVLNNLMRKYVSPVCSQNLPYLPTRLILQWSKKLKSREFHKLMKQYEKLKSIRLRKQVEILKLLDNMTSR